MTDLGEANLRQPTVKAVMRTLPLLPLAAMLACAGAETEVRPMLPDEVDYAPVLEVSLNDMERSQSGLYQQVLREGSGEPSAVGDSLWVEYTLWLPDGRKLDASADHSPPGPLAVVLGETQLIAGWVEAVTGMRLDERKRVVVPYDLGYGAQGAGGADGVPPYATLVFEMKVARIVRGA